MAATTERRTSLAGGDVEFLVLAGGRRWCAAIDLSNGALRTVEWDDDVEPPRALAVVRGRVRAPDEPPDPARPEAMALAGAPALAGRMPRRRAERWLRPLLHPDSEHLLGFPGPATPYWTLNGERASVALVAPPTPPVVAGGHCRFRWRNVVHALPVLPSALARRPRRPRRLVVALSPPRDGQCYKVVAGLL